jgi:hypothetical protein
MDPWLPSTGCCCSTCARLDLDDLGRLRLEDDVVDFGLRRGCRLGSGDRKLYASRAIQCSFKGDLAEAGASAVALAAVVVADTAGTFDEAAGAFRGRCFLEEDAEGFSLPACLWC